MEMTQKTHYATGCNVADLPEEIAHDLIFEDTNVPDDVFLLKRGDAKLFPLEALSILKAQMKNGKTVAAVMFASAFLAGTWEDDELQTLPTPEGIVIDGGVLYVDTEQSKASTKKIRRQITKLVAISWNGGTKGKKGANYSEGDYKAAVGALNRRLYVANVRAHNVEKRREHIAKLLDYAKGVKLVIIDGIKDICNDFNNIAEVAATMDVVTKWATTHKVHILCVLHENPSSDKARGHLGTELYNKATEIINVKRETADDGTKLNNFRVTWEAIREGAGVDALNFTRTNFGVYADGVPCYVSAYENPTDTPADTKTGGKTDTKTGGKTDTKTGAKPVRKNTLTGFYKYK